MSSTNRSSALFLLVLAGFAWGVTPLLVRLANWDAEGIAAMRLLLSASFLIVALHAHWKTLLKQLKFNWKAQLVTGLFAATSTSTFALACSYTEPAHVYLLYYLYPIYLLGLESLFIGEKLKKHQFFLCIGAAVGLLIFASTAFSSEANFLGDFYATISALSWVFYIICARKYLRSDYESLGANIIGQLVALVIFSPFVFDLIIDPQKWPNPNQWIWIISLGLASALPLFTWGWVIRHIPGHIAGTIVMIEAPLGVILCWLVLDIPIGTNEILGGSIILLCAGGILLGIHFSKNQ